MKIYTKTGDLGQTGLMGGKRVSKNTPRLHSYGDVDELNALLGLCRFHNKNSSLETILHRVQKDLFILGADLATPLETKFSVPRITQLQVKKLEHALDRIEKKLPELKNFILPGGNLVASTLHLARTVCRRAERSTVSLSEQERINPSVIPYLNRLSDLLFVLARFTNMEAGQAEEKWEA